MNGRGTRPTRDTPNADPERLGENVRLVGSGNWVADAQARLDEATNPRFRPDAIRGVEVFMGVSPAFKDTATDADWRVWVERSMGWLTDTFRDPRNVVAAVWRRGELTPHIQALVVPLREDNGRLSYEHYLGGSKYRLSELQTSYAEAVRDLGLERGVQDSQATHQDVQRWHARITEPTPAPEIVRQHLEVERPGRLVGNPERWASEQTERSAERITPALDAALTKATYYEEQAAKAEANVTVLHQQVRALEQENATMKQDYKALVAQVRGIELEDTMRALGGDRDRHDRHKKGGAALWEHVTEACPRAEAIERERPPAGAKDWNDALRAQERPRERAEGRVQEPERSQEQGRGHGGGGSGGRERDDTPGHRR